MVSDSDDYSFVDVCYVGHRSPVTGLSGQADIGRSTPTCIQFRQHQQSPLLADRSRFRRQYFFVVDGEGSVGSAVRPSGGGGGVVVVERDVRLRRQRFVDGRQQLDGQQQPGPRAGTLGSAGRRGSRRRHGRRVWRALPPARRVALRVQPDGQRRARRRAAVVRSRRAAHGTRRRQKQPEGTEIDFRRAGLLLFQEAERKTKGFVSCGGFAF